MVNNCSTVSKRLSSIAESSLSDILITDGFREDRIRYARQLLDSLSTCHLVQ
jgi:hypothetical protein